MQNVGERRIALEFELDVILLALLLDIVEVDLFSLIKGDDQAVDLFPKGLRGSMDQDPVRPDLDHF